MSITQEEFNHLISIPKVFSEQTPIELGPPPLHWSREIIGMKSKDIFLLDFHRGTIEISKYTYNKRFRQTIIMLRYDAKGRHTNPPPDEKTFDGPHVHIYKEGYDDKFAYPISEIGVNENDSMEGVLVKFLNFCNVKNLPATQITIE